MLRSVGKQSGESVESVRIEIHRNNLKELQLRNYCTLTYVYIVYENPKN